MENIWKSIQNYKHWPNNHTAKNFLGDDNKWEVFVTGLFVDSKNGKKHLGVDIREVWETHLTGRNHGTEIIGDYVKC